VEIPTFSVALSGKSGRSYDQLEMEIDKYRRYLEVFTISTDDIPCDIQIAAYIRTMTQNTKTICVETSSYKNWVRTLKNPTLKNPHFEFSRKTPSLATSIVKDRHYYETSTLHATRTAANTATADATDRYLSWASQAGITSPKVTQAFFGPIRGAKALDYIQPGETFITVPKPAALVVAPKERCPCPPDYIDADYYKKAPWFIQMAVQLLYNRSLGRQSPVWGFIEQLPTSIDAPVRWTLEDLDQLQYPELATRVIKQQQDWTRHYQDLQKALLEQGSSKLSWEDDFLWAVENVCSRAFSGPYTGSSLTDKIKTAGVVAAAGTALVFIQHIPLEQALNGAIAALVFNIIYDVVLSQKLKWYAMIPVLDACNHSSKIDSCLTFEYFQDAFTVSTTSGTRKGEQVFVSYGQKSNDGFLQYYGFTEISNPNDTYTFTVPDNNSDGNDGGKWKAVVNANGTFSGETLTKAKQLVSSLSALKEQGGGGGEEEEGVAARELLLKLIEEELASKATTLADDERTLQTAAHLLSGRVRCATEFRVQKKKVLQKCIDKTKKKINKLKGGRRSDS